MPHVRYDDPAPAPSCSTIIEHDVRQVYAVKIREYYFFYYLLAIQRRCASSMRAKQTPNCHTLAGAPMSLPQPPQPRVTADLIFCRWRVRLRRWMAAPSSLARRWETLVRRDASSTRPRNARQTPSCYPPCRPF